MTAVTYVDKQGVLKIYPSSGSTLLRQMEREKDPFPAGAKIGGKRYWRKKDVQDWLARQFLKPDKGTSESSPEPGEVAGTPAAGVA